MTIASSNTPIPVDDVFNEYESALKRQKSTTSKVWDEMTKLECKNKNELKAQRNHCKSIFFAKSSSGTSHLRRHLNNCLKKVNKDITQYTIAIQPSLGGGPLIKNYKFNANECCRAVSTFLMCVKYLFRAVEESGFRYMMRIASFNFKNISRYTIARDVLMYYAKEKDNVKEKSAKTPGLICLTSDNWNLEHTNNKYICISAYRVDKDWKLQKRIIRFRALFPSYDVLNIADMFISIVKADLELVDDVVDFVENILINLRLLFDEYVKKSKSTSSSLAESSNVSDKNLVDSSLHQHNLDIYLEESELELNNQIDVLDYWSKSSVRYSEFSLLARDLLAIPILIVAFESAFSTSKKVITPLRSSLKPKTIQVIICFDDWIRAKGFSTEIGCKNDDEDEDDEDDVSSSAF
ncbi:hypothetical protein CXB51_000988 [Gossypium anomalum]|uniref:HAT C-terminal dimerisation domain-containing protein n=1 Tax=Gossypium anomalum TaxID=47600 RepID=A0A8J6A2C2_9ROSI|nr:hypothetical protein CXB51_000988 [Gossypium anomalum]